jgi:hypothetical protein
VILCVGRAGRASLKLPGGWSAIRTLAPETGFGEIGPPLSPRIYLTATSRLVATTPYRGLIPRCGTGTSGATHGLAQRMALVFVSFADNATLIELSRDLWNGNLARTQEIVAKTLLLTSPQLLRPESFW